MDETFFAGPKTIPGWIKLFTACPSSLACIVRWVRLVACTRAIRMSFVDSAITAALVMTILVTNLVTDSAVALNRVVVLPRVGTTLESPFLAIRIHCLLVGQLQSGQIQVVIEEVSTYNAVAMVSVSHLGTKVLIARELVELARCV